MKIKTKEDCKKVLERIRKEDRQLTLVPGPWQNNYNGSRLRVVFTPDGYREFWHGDFGEVGENTDEEIINALWEYRKTFNTTYSYNDSIFE